jgi:hypothetical protein
LSDDIRHREGLAGAGGAQQNLVLVAALQSGDERGNRLRLVAHRSVRRVKLEFRHAIESF